MNDILKYEELYRQLLKLKQKELLNNSRFIEEKQISKDQNSYITDYFTKSENSNSSTEPYIKKMVCDSLAEFILKTKEMSKTNIGNNTYVYKIDLLVLHMGELKHIIDYIVKSLTQEQIDKIKNEICENGI